MIYVGIDPGKSGGLAAIKEGRAAVLPMPETGPEILLWLKSLTVLDYVHAFLEKGQSMPKNGGVHSFNYGHHNGLLEGYLQALEIPYTLIKPNVWMRRMHVGADSKADTKARSIQVCQRLFPGVNLLPTPRCKKLSDGMAEALLIAEDGRRTLQGAVASGTPT